MLLKNNSCWSLLVLWCLWHWSIILHKMKYETFFPIILNLVKFACTMLWFLVNFQSLHPSLSPHFRILTSYIKGILIPFQCGTKMTMICIIKPRDFLVYLAGAWVGNTRADRGIGNAKNNWAMAVSNSFRLIGRFSLHLATSIWHNVFWNPSCSSIDQYFLSYV